MMPRERNAAWGGLDELAQKSPNNLWRFEPHQALSSIYTNPIFFVFCLLLLGSTFQLPITHLCFVIIIIYIFLVDWLARFFFSFLFIYLFYSYSNFMYPYVCTEYTNTHTCACMRRTNYYRDTETLLLTYITTTLCFKKELSEGKDVGIMFFCLPQISLNNKITYRPTSTFFFSLEFGAEITR